MIYLGTHHIITELTYLTSGRAQTKYTLNYSPASLSNCYNNNKDGTICVSRVNKEFGDKDVVINIISEGNS